MRTIFVGDVHGCAVEFAAFLEKISYDQAKDRLLLTGDAFARGPDPLAVWQLICDTGAEMVLGNHDARLLKQLTALAKGRKPKVKFPDQCYTPRPASACPRQNPRLVAAVPALHCGRRLPAGPRRHPPEKGLTRHPPQRIPEDPHLAALRRSRQPALARFLRAGVSPDRLWPRRARRLGGQKERWSPLSSWPRLGLYIWRPTQWLCARRSAAGASGEPASGGCVEAAGLGEVAANWRANLK